MEVGLARPKPKKTLLNAVFCSFVNKVSYLDLNPPLIFEGKRAMKSKTYMISYDVLVIGPFAGERKIVYPSGKLARPTTWVWFREVRP